MANTMHPPNARLGGHQLVEKLLGLWLKINVVLVQQVAHGVIVAGCLAAPTEISIQVHDAAV